METTKNAGVLKVLSVSPMAEDHRLLQAIVDHTTWRLLKADRLSEAFSVLRQHEISVVLCERDLVTGNWADVLEAASELPCPPSLIVTSRVADERLWGEALNLGAWDVLAKPFDRSEVLRSIKTAWQHWYNQAQLPAKVMRAAS